MWAQVCPTAAPALTAPNRRCLSRFLSPGIQSEFFINTTQAGPGTLSVTIEGPSKVKMDCQEIPEGYKVMYTPMAPGNYLIGVKYGGPNHISRSPFKAKVTGKRSHFGVSLLPCRARLVALLVVATAGDC